MEINIKWYSMPNNGGKKVPEHLVTLGITDDNKVYVSAGLTGDEIVALANACWDGIPFIPYLDHAFLPLDWIIKNYPMYNELYDKIKIKAEFIINQETKTE